MLEPYRTYNAWTHAFDCNPRGSVPQSSRMGSIRFELRRNKGPA